MMRTHFKRVMLTFTVAVAACIVFQVALTLAHQRNFRAGWVRRLENCRTEAAVRKLRKPSIGELEMRTFHDGSWIAVAWRCSHDDDVDGAGEWDQDIFCDSSGHVYTSTHHFCGHEGFAAEFLHDPSTSASAYLRQPRLALQRVR